MKDVIRKKLQIYIDTITAPSLNEKYKQIKQHYLFINSYKSNAGGIFMLNKESFPISDFINENIIEGNLTKISFQFDNDKFSIMALYQETIM